MRLGRSLPVNEAAPYAYGQPPSRGLASMNGNGSSHGSQTVGNGGNGHAVDAAPALMPALATVGENQSGGPDDDDENASMPPDFGGRQIALDTIADPRLETKLSDWQVVTEALLDLPVPSLIEDEYAPKTPTKTAPSTAPANGLSSHAAPSAAATSVPAVGVGGENGSGCSHLVVLVHGYSGSAYDLRLLCSYMQLQLPHAAFLISQANQQRVNISIEMMAERLAAEIDGFISASKRQLVLKRLSFVAFSIGGCVLNAALTLPPLQKYRHLLHTLAAISCPLLGLLVPGTSFAVSSGLWFMAKVAGDKALKQLCFADTHDDGPVVWRLNGKGVFPAFRHVILVGSRQDKFIPLYSSHMQPPGNLPDSDPRARAVRQMVANAMSSLKRSTLIRVTVHFHGMNPLSMDEAFGRAAHVAFLEHVPFMRLFAARYSRFFSE